ncbi:MAG: YeeE/YedE family protein [Rhodospirillaceae bacterium]|nr:YeeE/YedE family protein [Rhodospirillaceae bacterium]
MAAAAATAAISAAAPGTGVDRGPTLTILATLLLGAMAITDLITFTQGALFLVGGISGVALYHASFGFTGGWRRMVLERRSAALRAQMLMVGIAAFVMIPLVTEGRIFGQILVGASAPIGVSVALGAAMFGFGMQLGGGCGSGTLFAVGGGSARMLVTLFFFILGSLLATAHLPWWLTLPSFPEYSLGANLGAFGGLAVTLLGLAAVAFLVARIEIARHGSLEKTRAVGAQRLDRLLHGPWPLIWGALALAAVNIATLLLSGHTWSITFAFGLWGAKAAQVLGVAVETWPFWTWPGPSLALHGSILADDTSVMDFGLILGAALAASLAGKFAPNAKLPFLSVLAAAIGGALMGYGARLAFGCNIGALFSGIATGSLHGWLWFGCAFVGSWSGVRARPAFGLA